MLHFPKIILKPAYIAAVSFQISHGNYGNRKVYYASRSALEPIADYDGEKDVMFLKDSDACDELLLRSGEFMIFYPQDAHKPAMAYEGKKIVQKLVFKVKMDI